jgi:ABC-type sugar transport system ATPase subunit
LDEPFSNLDAVHKCIIKSVLQDVTEKFGISSILVSHDALDILSWADMILVMKDGHLIQQASPEIIYRQPVNEYVAGLLGAYNLISPSLGAALTGIKEINKAGKKIMVRPENIIIENKKGNAVKGIIQHIRFWGSYYTLSVLVSGELITVKTNQEEYKTGDPVYLSLSLNVLWYV